MTLVSCGSPESTQETTPAPGAAHGAFAHCLAEHGITGPDGGVVGPPMGPTAPPAGVDAGAWERAMQDCGGFGPGPAGPEVPPR